MSGERDKTEILVLEEFEDWFVGLDDPDASAVARVIGLLEVKGTTLGFPYCSAIRGARYAIRELRAQSRGEPLRVFYAFDPKRQAVLILGGNKAGNKRFYEQEVPRAERLWERYLAEDDGERQ